MRKILTLHLKKEYWQQIKDGKKKVEYRDVTPYWKKRLDGKEYSEIHLLLGYPKAQDESKLIRRKWNGYTFQIINHPYFGLNIPVFVIDVSRKVWE
jgi:hypothetical protein